MEALSSRSRLSLFESPVNATIEEPLVSRISSPKDAISSPHQNLPDPKIRLAQARIFLADEDYYRNLSFIKKLAEIEAYVKLLEKRRYKGEDRQIREIKEMIWVHKCWIREATEPPSMNLQFAKFDHKNRLVEKIKDTKKHRAIAHTKAPPAFDRLSGRLDPGPAIHMAMDDLNGRNGKEKLSPSPDPFLYTKKLAKFQHVQKLIVEDTRVLKSNRDAQGYVSVTLPASFSESESLVNNRSQEEWKDNGSTRSPSSAIHATKDEVQTIMTSELVMLATQLSAGEFISEHEAGRLLQGQIIDENHHNWERKTPSFSEIWTFEVGVQKPKSFFSLDRWPIEMQTIERANEIMNSGPKWLSSKEFWEKRRALVPHNDESEENKDPRETYIHGKPYFPFGETPFQEAALSWEIEQDLAHVPEYAHMYRINKRGQKVLIVPEEDPFALPEIAPTTKDNHSSFTSRFMSVLGKRRRGNPSNGTVELNKI